MVAWSQGSNSHVLEPESALDVDQVLFRGRPNHECPDPESGETVNFAYHLQSLKADTLLR